MQEVKEEIPTDNCFKVEATTFRMKISYSDADGVLAIRVEDLEEWIVYSKQFREGCVNTADGQSKDNRGLHKKMDLKDIYEAITEAEDNEGGQAEGSEEGDVRPYKHGVQIKKNGVPCYKIQNGGKLTIYLSVTNNRNKKLADYCSTLYLTKISEMTEVQKIRQLSVRQKRQLIAAFKKQLLQKQSTIAQSAQQLQSTTQQLQSTTQQLNTKSTQLTAIKSIQQKIQKSLVNFTYVHPANSSFFPFVFNKVVPYGEAYKFKIKINSIPSFCVGIGVVDIEKYKHCNSTLNNQNYAVAYYCTSQNTGHKYPGGVQQGTGFAQGQIVEVTVNLANRSITWAVANTVRATHAHDMLADQSRIFMPFVESPYNNTSLLWVE